MDKHVFYSYTAGFTKMLFRSSELQRCEYGYEDYIASLFNIMLLLVSRQQQKRGKQLQASPKKSPLPCFENYMRRSVWTITQESLHISTNWFIRNF